MDTYNNWLQLIADALADLAKYNVKIIFVKSKNVLIEDENILVSGYWDDALDNNLSLACASGKHVDKWGPIFAHEYCHFLQWKDKTTLWKKSRTVSVNDLNAILQNKPVTLSELTRGLNISRDLELDCEKRVVKLLKKYKVPTNIGDYIRRANVYVHFYNYIKEYRNWYPPNQPPYSKKNLLRVASDKFYDSYEDIPPELEEAFRKSYPLTHKSILVEK